MLYCWKDGEVNPIRWSMSFVISLYIKSSHCKHIARCSSAGKKWLLFYNLNKENSPLMSNVQLKADIFKPQTVQLNLINLIQINLFFIQPNLHCSQVLMEYT